MEVSEKNVRSFPIWKREILSWLTELWEKVIENQTPVDKEKTEELLRDIQDLYQRATYLKRYGVPMIVGKFMEFRNKWHIDIPRELFPTKEELKEWKSIESEPIRPRSPRTSKT